MHNHSMPADRNNIFRRLRQGSFWIASGRVLAMIIVFANLVLLAKLLSVEDFSAYVVTISVVTLSSVGAMFGLNYLVCKLVSAYLGVLDKANAMRSVLIVGATSFATSVIVAVGVGMGCLYFGDSWFNRPMISEMSWSIGLWILFLAFSQIVAEIFRGLHNLFAAGLLAGISGGLFANAIFLLGMVIAHFYGELNYSTIVKLGALSFVLPILVSIVWLKATWPSSNTDHSAVAEQVKPIAITSVLAEAMPIMLLSFVALGFDRSGQLIAGAFGVDSDVSVFEATWQLAFLPIVPLTILGLSVASTVSELYAQKNTKAMEEILKYASTFSLLLSLPIILVLSIFGGPILSLIFDPSFSVGASAMVILCVVQLIRNWMGPCDILLVMTGQQNEAFICFLIAAPLLLLGPWAVDNYGVIGLTSVVALAILVSRVLQYFVVIWKLGVSPHAELNPTFLKQLSLIVKGKLHLS